MAQFTPKRVFVEPDALNYPMGRRLYEYFQRIQIPVLQTSSHNRVTGIPGKTAAEGYREAKSTLVIGVRRSKDFETCRPSAHYQLPLATSCPGKCEYCYLATTLGKKPYVRIYVNVEEILKMARQYIEDRRPEETVFEGSATSDPIPVEPYTNSLAAAVEFFAAQEFARFRFVTKFTDVESLLDIKHEGRTRFRFSINLQRIIGAYEHGTPDLAARLQAAKKSCPGRLPIRVNDSTDLPRRKVGRGLCRTSGTN